MASLHVSVGFKMHALILSKSWIISLGEKKYKNDKENSMQHLYDWKFWLFSVVVSSSS